MKIRFSTQTDLYCDWSVQFEESQVMITFSKSKFWIKHRLRHTKVLVVRPIVVVIVVVFTKTNYFCSAEIRKRLVSQECFYFYTHDQ